MRILRIVLLVATAARLTPALLSQTQPNVENGFKPYGSYDGGNIDTVNLLNGNLILSIPAPVQYPQRGSLKPQLMYYQTSKNWIVRQVDSGTGVLVSGWEPGVPSFCVLPFVNVKDNEGFETCALPGQGLWSFSLDIAAKRSIETDIGADGTTTYIGFGYSLITWDTVEHRLHAVPTSGIGNNLATQFDSVDSTGYHVQLSNPDANGIMRNITITDRAGNQYQGTFPPANNCITGPLPVAPLGLPDPSGGGYAPEITGSGAATYYCGQLATFTTVTDPNGNVASTTNGPDTLARPAPTPTAPADSADCVSRLPITAATQAYLGYNGAYQVTWCTAAFPLLTSFGQSGVVEVQNLPNIFPVQPKTQSMVTSIVLPDRSRWTFDYDSYANVTSLGLPLGGSIAYTWTTVAFPTCDLLTKVSRGVKTRTINDGNGHTFLWTYNWGTLANNTITNTVTDPLLNDTEHVFTDLGGGSCAFYETATRYYQGTGGSRTLLKEIDTQYASTVISTDTDNIYTTVGNVFATDITTIVYPSGKTSKVHRTADKGLGAGQPIFGNVTQELDYDWSGALLRETDTVYQWQKNSQYLTAHVLDAAASAVTVDPNAANNLLTACPVDPSGTTKTCIAETDYVYDESIYIRNYEQSPEGGALPAGTHVAAPNAVRGLATSVSRRLNTSTTPVTSHTFWYNTGEVYQEIDPLGHTTQHTYATANAGAYPTQTCMPSTVGGSVSHCVSGTYDFNTGLLTSFTDQNTQTSNYSYDLMSRLTLAQAPADPSNSNNRSKTIITPPVPIALPLNVPKQKSITTATMDSSSITFDGLGRPVHAFHTTPQGTATVDTAFDALDHSTDITNPYFSTADSTYGSTHTDFDALGRPLRIKEQDASIKTVDYSFAPTLAAPGDCTRTIDELANQRLGCNDSLGRLIEVHEAGTPFNGSQATGNITISGTERVQNNVGAHGSAYATVQIPINGQDQETVVQMPTPCDPPLTCDPTPVTVWDSGKVYITINGREYDYFFGQQANGLGDFAATVAFALVAAIQADPARAVNASQLGGNLGTTIVLTAVSPGSAGNNITFSSGYTWDSTDFAGPSYTTGPPVSGHLAGGIDGYAGVTVPDTGTVKITVGTFVATAAYGQNSTAASIAASLVDPANPTSLAAVGSPVKNSNLHASGSIVYMTYTDLGPIGDVSVTTSSNTTQTQWNFGSPSFAGTNTVLSGGYNPEGPSVDFNYYVTQYQYDAVGNLLCVEQHGNVAPGTAGATGCNSPPASDATSPWRVRRFTYDSLSRLLTAKNPESGTITYSYDADGNLLQKTSPAPNQTGSATQTISYCYDELHRVTGKAYSAQTCQGTQLPTGSAVVSYTYDSGTNAKGKLTGITDQAGTASFSYDVLGRLSTETRVISGISKTISYDYNLDGSVYRLHYPSGAVVTYTPDSAGRLLSAVDSTNNITYVTSATYQADGQMTGFVSGNGGAFAGITNSFSYNKRLQPINMSASVPSQTVFSIGYDFHVGNGSTGADNGNVWGITNYRDNSRNQSFTYDALNRLTSAQNAGTDCTVHVLGNNLKFWGNTYTYDPWGNLTNKTKITTACSGENLNINAGVDNKISSAGYVYDAAGNMTTDGTEGVSASYDQENHIATATRNGVSTSYTYDADGNRVKKSNSSTTLYWYMTPGIVAESDQNGTLKSEYIFFGGERVARKDFSGSTTSVFYYFSDHLKTASVITDSAGNIKAESDYYPWGGELQFVANDSNHYKFTGKERDTETNLDYFGARYYSNGLGRFITPDWAAKATAVPYAEFSDPQSLNLYSYVRNIPTSRADLEGHQSTTQELVTDRQVSELLRGVGRRIFWGTVARAVSVVAGAAVVLGIATAAAPSVGQSNADERAANQQGSQDRAAQNGGVDPQHACNEPQPAAASGGNMKGGKGLDLSGITRNSDRGVDFSSSPYLMQDLAAGQKNIVDIQYTGSRTADFAVANKAGGFTTTPQGYTWHHLDNYNAATNTGTMQLVRTDAHQAISHYGGVRQYEQAMEIDYRP